MDYEELKNLNNKHAQMCVELSIRLEKQERYIKELINNPKVIIKYDNKNLIKKCKELEKKHKKEIQKLNELLEFKNFMRLITKKNNK